MSLPSAAMLSIELAAGQMRDSDSSSSDRMSCAATSAVGGAAGPRGLTSASNRPPGRPSSPKTSGCSRMASPSRRSSVARPARPTSGLISLTWKASPSRSVTSARRPAASACSGRSGSDENRPLVKAWKLATASPSERVKRWPVAGST